MPEWPHYKNSPACNNFLPFSTISNELLFVTLTSLRAFMEPPWWKASVVSLETSSFLDVDPWWLRQLKPWRGPVQTGKSRQFNGQLCSSAPPQFTVVGSCKRKKISQRRFLYFRVSSVWAFFDKSWICSSQAVVGQWWGGDGSLGKCRCSGDGSSCANRPCPPEKIHPVSF